MTELCVWMEAVLLEYGPVIKALLYLYRAVRQQNVEEALKFLRGIVVSTESRSCLVVGL